MKSKRITFSTIVFQDGSEMVGQVDIYQNDRSDSLPSAIEVSEGEFLIIFLMKSLMEQSQYSSGLDASDKS